jgi:hypothetical protein
MQDVRNRGRRNMTPAATSPAKFSHAQSAAIKHFAHYPKPDVSRQPNFARHMALDRRSVGPRSPHINDLVRGYCIT